MSILDNVETKSIDTEGFARYLCEKEINKSWDDLNELAKVSWLGYAAEIFEDIDDFREYLQSNDCELVIVQKNDNIEDGYKTDIGEQLWRQENHR